MPITQRLCPTDRALSACDGMLFAPRPSADTHEFSGHLVLYDSSLEGGSVQERAYPTLPYPLPRPRLLWLYHIHLLWLC